MERQFTASPAKSDQTVIISGAILAALTPLIPIPLVDDLAKAHFRRRMVRKIAESHNVPLAPHAVPILADEPPGSCLGCIGTAILYPLSKIFRKIFIFLEWKRAADTMSRTYYHGFLLSCAMEARRMAPVGSYSPSEVRAAVDSVLRQTDTSPLNAAVRGVFSQSRTTLRGAVAVLQKQLRPLAQLPTPGRVGDAIDSSQDQEDAMLVGVVSKLQESLATLPANHFLQLRARLLELLPAENSVSP